jgi:hypothetical protein
MTAGTGKACFSKSVHEVMPGNAIAALPAAVISSRSGVGTCASAFRANQPIPAVIVFSPLGAC